jgi:glutamine amidotransferase PdxT
LKIDAFIDLYMCIWYVKNVALRRIGVKGVEIRKPEQLGSVDSLIIPGGESTTMAKLAELHNLVSFISILFLFVL